MRIIPVIRTRFCIPHAKLTHLIASRMFTNRIVSAAFRTVGAKRAILPRVLKATRNFSSSLPKVTIEQAKLLPTNCSEYPNDILLTMASKFLIFLVIPLTLSHPTPIIFLNINQVMGDQDARKGNTVFILKLFYKSFMPYYFISSNPIRAPGERDHGN